MDSRVLLRGTSLSLSNELWHRRSSFSSFPIQHKLLQCHRFISKITCSSSIQPSDVSLLAKKSKICLTPSEVEEFGPKIQQVIGWFGELQAVDLETIEPSIRVDTENNLRDNIPETFEPSYLNSHKMVKTRSKHSISCTAQPIQSNIKVVINGAAKEIGRAAVLAVTNARGMEVAGAVDTYHIGEDIGKICGMEEPLEIPILNDLTMVLGSISQSKETAVVVDFTDPSSVYDNVKQATAFGMKSVVYVPRIKLDTVAALSACIL